MHIQVALTKDIINQCLELHYDVQPAGKKSSKRLLLIPMLLVVLGGYLIYDEMRQPTPGQNLYMGVLYIGFAIAYYFFMRGRMLNAGGKIMKRMGANATFVVDASQDKVVTKTATQDLVNYWPDFTGALISKGNVLLYQQNETFTMFNHTFFKEGQFEQFKNLVREKVHPVKEVYTA